MRDRRRIAADNFPDTTDAVRVAAVAPIDEPLADRIGAGSLDVKFNVYVAASLTVAAPSMVSVGATLSTIKSNVTDVYAVPSSAVIVTVCDSSGPSLVLNDQDQFPPPESVAVPTDAERVNVSDTSTSLKVPLLLAVCPSSTVAKELFAETVGASLLPVISIVTS